MSELLRKAVEKTRILRARPHLKPVAAGGGELSKAERWRTAQMAQDWLNANADPKYHRRRLPDMEENGQFKLLTRGRLGMRLKEFRYYQPPGGYYGNPYDKDFVQERQKERRNGLIKAGIVGAGLLGGGALLGRGLYKVGKSGAVRRAEDLAEELTKLRATKAAADVPQVAPAPRGRPKTQNNTPPPAPPQTPAPTPPQTPSPTSSTPPTGKKPQSKVVENLNQQGDLPAGDAAAEIDEITAAKPPRKLTKRQQQLANRKVRAAKFAAAQSPAPAAVAPTKAPAAAKTPAAPKTPTKKPQTPPAKPGTSATNEEFWESGGKKIPLTGTAAERAALRGELDKVSASDGFKGQVVGDVVDAARARATASLKPKSDFPEGLSDRFREAGRANNPKSKKNSKATKESKAKKNDDEADDLDDDDLDDIADEPDASPEEAEWEANRNDEVRPKKTSAKPTKGKAAKKPTAKSKGKAKGKKEAVPLSYAERLAAKVKAKRDRKKNLSALLSRVRYFNQFQTDEAGIPLTGRVARDRFVKKLRDEDLDRRDANILRAGGAGALAGLLARGRIGASKRALIGAGAGGLGVIGIRALTNNDRDIYGERDRGSKRAELLPAVGGLGAAAWLAGKRLKAFAKKIDHRGHREHGGVKEFSILNKISNLTGMAQIKAGREALEKAKWSRKHALLASPMRLDGGPAYGVRKFPHAREATREARRLIDEGVRRRNTSIGVGAGVAGAAGAGYLAMRKKEFVRGDYMAKLLPSERFEKRVERGVPYERVLPAPEKHSAYSKYVADKMRTIRRAKKLFSSRLRGVKEFGSMSHARLVRKLKGHLSRADDHLLVSEMPNAQGFPGVRVSSERPSYAGWAAKENNLLKKLRYKDTSSALRRGRHGRGLGIGVYYDFSSRLRGVKEFGSSGLGRLYRKKASLLKKGVFIERRNPDAPVLQPGAIWPGFIETPSFVARGNVNMKTGQVYSNQMLPSDQQKYAGIYHRIASKEKPRFIDGIEVAENSVPGEFTGKLRQRKIHSDWLYRHDKKMRGFSARLRGLKNFDDYRLYYFKGRNTGIAARSAEEARSKKKRGGDELVAVRTPNETERSQMARGIWVRTRRDGKSPQKSRYGKGRGQGPARKSLSARLSSLKFFENREKRGMNPYVGAALSGFGSGAALGSLALLRRGATFRGAAKTAAKLGLASAGIVGGGALLGSKIVGDPRKEESAPFMKRAAIGGTLVGAGAGLGGALLLRKTKGGARALVAASKKSEPFSRPAMWLRKSPLLGATGIGAVGGALYGGGMGLDEGQQVDSIRNIKKDLKKNLSARLRLRLFGRGDQARWDARRGGGVGSNEDSQFANTAWGWATDRPMYVAKRDDTGRVVRDENGDAIRVNWDPSSGQLWNSIAREAKNKRVTVQRGGRLSRDLVDELRGAPRQRDASGRIKKREWEKSWFHNKATEIGMTAAGLGGLATVRYANNNPDTKIGQAYSNTKKSIRATKDGLADIGKNILTGITKVTAKKAFSAKLKRLRELDAMAEYVGWDMRDPRGKSVRVFAPGSRKRERRPKEWHEKTENERKLWKAGIAAGVLGGVGVTLVGQRLVSGKSLIPSRFLKKKPIDPSVFVHTPPTAKQADEILKNWKTP